MKNERVAQLTTIRRFRDLSGAIVARSLLEASGIQAYLCDENLIRLDWQISNFIGGLRLQVEAEDEQEATQLLDLPTPNEIDYGSQDGAFKQPHCPRCNSIDITFDGSARTASLAALYVLSIPMPLGLKTWTCNDCANRWQGDGVA